MTLMHGGLPVRMPYAGYTAAPLLRGLRGWAGLLRAAWCGWRRGQVARDMLDVMDEAALADLGIRRIGCRPVSLDRLDMVRMYDCDYRLTADAAAPRGGRHG